MAFGLDKTSFLDRFYRMDNKRRVPVEVITDNCGRFLATYKELKELSHLDDVSSENKVVF